MRPELRNHFQVEIYFGKKNLETRNSLAPSLSVFPPHPLVFLVSFNPMSPNVSKLSIKGSHLSII